MINNKKSFVDLLQDLCEIYKDYIYMNVNTKLQVVIEDNKIGISLYRNSDIIDFFELSFKEKERKLYLDLSVIIMRLLFGSLIIYNSDNLFYNENKPYLEVIVNDNEMLNKIFNVVALRGIECIYDNVSGINKRDYINDLEERIKLSRKLLRLDGGQ